MTTQRPELTFQEFEHLLVGAFLPYQCSFTLLDHGTGFSFILKNDGKNVLEVSYHNRRRITDKLARSVISQTRRNLFSSGHRLKPWRFPERAGAGAI